jgi:hypothetical protein
MQPVTRRQSQVSIQLIDIGVDEHGRTTIRATHQIRTTAARNNLLKKSET